MRGLGDAGQHAAAPDCDGDGAGRQRLLRGRQALRAALAKAGVEVQLVSTAGSVETVALLRDPHSGVSVGMIQGGVVGAANTAGLESMGTGAYEPVWVFRRPPNQAVGAYRLSGRKRVVRPVGSGARALSLGLIKPP